MARPRKQVASASHACRSVLIQKSGPHLIFVTLYAQSVIPFGVLLASSIVQTDMACCRLLRIRGRAFIAVKAINLHWG